MLGGMPVCVCMLKARLDEVVTVLKTIDAAFACATSLSHMKELSKGILRQAFFSFSRIAK